MFVSYSRLTSLTTSLISRLIQLSNWWLVKINRSISDSSVAVPLATEPNKTSCSTKLNFSRSRRPSSVNASRSMLFSCALSQVRCCIACLPISVAISSICHLRNREMIFCIVPPFCPVDEANSALPLPHFGKISTANLHGAKVRNRPATYVSPYPYSVICYPCYEIPTLIYPHHQLRMPGCHSCGSPDNAVTLRSRFVQSPVGGKPFTRPKCQNNPLLRRSNGKI